MLKSLVKNNTTYLGITYQVVDSQTFIALFQQFQEKEKKTKTFLHILCFEYKALFV